MIARKETFSVSQRLTGLRPILAGVLAAFLLAAQPVGANAQEISESHLAAARAAVAASKSTQQLDNILPNIGERTKQQLISNRPDAAEKISTIVDEVTISLASRRGDLEREVAVGYARVFTEDELKQITEFYSTPAGQKLITETPVIARSIEQAARVWSNGLQRDLQDEVRKRLEAEGL
jgi:hypothetical protein